MSLARGARVARVFQSLRTTRPTVFRSAQAAAVFRPMRLQRRLLSTDAEKPAADSAKAAQADAKASGEAKSADSKSAESKTNGGADKDAAIKALEKQLADKTAALAESEKKVAELKHRVLTELAEMENVRMRSRADVKAAQQFGLQKFAKALLEVADTLHMAVVQTKKGSDNPDVQQLFEGVQLTEKVLHQVFERHGLKKFEAVGHKFDPNVHDGVYAIEDATKPPGTVAEVMVHGYMLNDRVIRPAKVAMVKGTYKAPAGDAAQPKAEEKSN